MNHRLLLTTPTNHPLDPRIGGEALIDGVANWPRSPEGEPLVLIASLPNSFISQATGLKLAPNFYTSIFSYYSSDDYFLDQITYHGDPEELSWIKRGSTKVLQHPAGKRLSPSAVIPMYRLALGESVTHNNKAHGSHIGGKPGLLQNEQLDLQDLAFALQLSGSDFPKAYSDIFALADAIGYISLKENNDAIGESGLFFVQTT